MPVWVRLGCWDLAGFIRVCVVYAATALAITEPYAVIQRLDKITARTDPIELRIGDHARFGSLDIEVKICHRSAPEDDPENAAFVEIREITRGDGRRYCCSAVGCFHQARLCRRWNILFTMSGWFRAGMLRVRPVTRPAGKDASTRKAAPSSTE